MKMSKRGEVKSIIKPCSLILAGERDKQSFSESAFNKVVKRARDGEASALDWLESHGYIEVQKYDPPVAVKTRVGAGR